MRVFDNLKPQVHGGLREQGKWPQYLAPESERILGDVRDRAALAASLRGIETVFHLAAATGVGQSMYQIAKYFEVNVQGTANLLDALANESHEVRKLVLASSRAVYGEGAYECPTCGIVHPPVRAAARLDRGAWEPSCPHCDGEVAPVPTPETLTPEPGSMYGITKLSQELMCTRFGEAYGLPVVVLRLFNVYGPRQSLSNPYTGIITTFVNALRGGRPPEVYEDGLMTRDFVHVSDVVRACLLAQDWGGPTGLFNIGSGEELTILKLAGMLSGMMGQGLKPRITGAARVGDVRHCVADLARAGSQLGYGPEVTLVEGLANVVDHARDERSSCDALVARRELEQAGMLRA